MVSGSQAWRREEGRFRRDYNDKIFNGLVVRVEIEVAVEQAAALSVTHIFILTEFSSVATDYGGIRVLQILALADILLFRFILRVSIAETAGWVGFIFLQVARPRLRCLVHAL